MNKNITILQHNINYFYYDNDMEMPESEQTHIKEMIVAGYNQGELNYLDENDEEIRGWWKIERL